MEHKNTGKTYLIKPITVVILILIAITIYAFTCRADSHQGKPEYVVYHIMTSQDLYDFAESVVSHDSNVWEAIYDIKEINSISGDLVSGGANILIPIKYIPDSNTDLLCNNSSNDSEYNTESLVLTTR